jgi:tetratricopeptide (TPR) repeat protein
MPKSSKRVAKNAVDSARIDPFRKARAALEKGRHAEALLLCETAIETQADGAARAAGFLVKAKILAATGAPDHAFAAMSEALKADERHAPAWRAVAARHLADKKPVEALKTVLIAVALEPGEIENHLLLGDILIEVRRPKRAHKAYSDALALSKGSTRALAGLALAHEKMGEAEEALVLVDRVLALDPQSTRHLLARGRLLSNLGRVDDSESCYAKVLKRNPDDVTALMAWLGRRKTPARDAWIERAMKAVAREETSDHVRIVLLAGVGANLEKIGDRDAAFDVFEMKNRIAADYVPFDASILDAELEGARRLWTREAVSRWSDHGRTGSAPILIVGMPRSGTTLVEQILAGAPGVVHAGELDDLRGAAKACIPGGTLLDLARVPEDRIAEVVGGAAVSYLSALEEYGPTGSRRIDKMPENFRHAGLAGVIAPDAKIVHCIRDPRDVCFSIFKHQFNVTGHPYAYGFDRLAAMYAFQLDIMRHWDEVLPGMILRIVHEELIDDPETHGRRLAEHCGIDWSPDLLDVGGSGRYITTSSSRQIRQGINRSGVGAWRKYEHRLGGMFEALERHGILPKD